MLSPGFQEWVILVDNLLQHPGSVDIEVGLQPTIFRVPAQIREDSEPSYTPKVLSLGLYGIDTREVSSVDNFRRLFSRIFMEITGKEWKEICLEVVGDSVEYWVQHYDGFKLQSPVVDQAKQQAGDGAPDGIGHPKMSMLDCIRTLLTMDAIFLVCFITAVHQSGCKQAHCLCKEYPILKKVVEQNILWSTVDLMGIDLMKFENQIPLPLIKNVVDMMYKGAYEAGTQPPVRGLRSEQRRDPFSQFMEYPMDMFRWYIPGREQYKLDFVATLKKIKFSNCRHLLHCLYSVVCYRLDRNFLDNEDEIVESTLSNPPQDVLTSSAPPSTTCPEAKNRDKAQPATRDPRATTHDQGEDLPISLTLDFQQDNPGGAQDDGVKRAPPAAARESLRSRPAIASEHGQHRNTGGRKVAAAQRLLKSSLSNSRKSSWASVFISLSARCFKRPHRDRRSYKVPTASQLKYAGIRVAVGSGNPRISDVNFERGTFRGTLYLPAFEVNGATETLLRNMITYEYVVEKRSDLNSYMYLMKNLIHTEEDLQLMENSGVLKIYEPNRQNLVTMWKTMLNGVVLPSLSEQYQKAFNEITTHYDNNTHKFVEEFRNLYLRRPWVAGGVFLGLTAWIATLLAAVYTILSYYCGNKSPVGN